MGYHRSLIFVPVIFSLITSCVSVKPDIPATITPEVTPNVSNTAISASPTTKLPEVSTSTPSPVLNIPSLSLNKITPENTISLTQVKMLGDGQVSDVAFSPGGGLIAASSNIGIRVHGGQDLIERVFIPTADPVARIAFSPDGRLLAAGTQAGTIQIYSVNDLVSPDNKPIAPLKEIKANNFAITCLVFAPDSQSLSSGSLDRTILVWDPSTGKKIRSLSGFILGISAIAYSMDGTMLAGSSLDGVTRIWRFRTGEQINSSGSPDNKRQRVDHFPIRLGFQPGEWLVSTWADGDITAWHWQDTKSEPVNVHNQPDGYSYSLISPETGQITAANQDGKVQIFKSGSVNTESLPLTQGLSFETNGGIISASLSADGKRLVTASYPAEISLWDMATGEMVRSFSRSPHGRQVIASAFSPDSKFLATSHGDGLIRIWDAANLENYFEFEVNNSETTLSLQFSPDGKQLIIGADAIYQYFTDKFRDHLLQRQSSSPVQALIQLPFVKKISTVGMVQSVVLSPDGKYLASSNLMSKLVQIWNLASGKMIGTLSGFDDPVEVLAFSPDSHDLAAGSADHKVHIWHLDKLLSETSGVNPDHNDEFLSEKPDLIIKTDFAVLSLIYSPDGSQMAISGTDWNVRMVNSSNGGLLFLLKGARDQIVSTAISSDGKLFATGDADGIIRVYGSGQGVPLLVLEGHAGMVNTLNFSPDRRMLISGGEDSTIRLWGIVD
jgi:WD40 repeat protein